jgi:putative peptide zinc metalloprotease protein
VTTLVDAPTRIDGVQLIGEMVGSGYRTPPALVRRADGQVLQLTPLVYLVLDAVDGRRSCAEIADLVSSTLRRDVTEADVRTLVDRQLRPLGLLREADGAEPELRRTDPLLGLKFRVAITSARTTRRVTDPFRFLFRPPIPAAIVAGFVAVVAWVFFERGLAASAYDAFERPHLLLLVFLVTVLSGGLHEFGHAAAARYSGAEPGKMGAGLYLVWPAFYTDVTDSYRLDRAGRIRTDLGGLYFNAVVVVMTFVWWWTTGWEALLLLVATQVLQMTQQLLPLLRFDGYHVLADVAGVPDLYQRIKPTLLGLLPQRWNAPENRMLKPASRVVITLWVLVTIPMMALMLWAVVKAVPRLLGSAGSVMSADAAAVGSAWSSGSGIDVAGHVLQLLGVVLPMLACGLILSRTGLRFFRGLARWSQGSASKRVVATAAGAAVIAGLAWAWWPHADTYRPIQPGERGLITTLLPVSNTSGEGHARPAAGIAGAAAAHDRLSSDKPLVAAFQEGKALPTKEDPTLALVLVPSDGADTAGPANGSDDAWVFPFDKPLLPDEGDNQALAVATTDGAVRYDVAFALVWAEGNEVLNVNEAHAYASCSDCVAVAVAFQVVLIMDDAQVVVPQNLAVAANYDCYRCITAAIANQLVLSVEGEPGEEELRELAAVWDQLIEFAHRITSYSLAQIAAGLESFKSEIVDILAEAPVVESEPSASTTTSPDSGQDGSDSPAPPESTTTAPDPSPVDEATTSPPGPTGGGSESAPPSPSSSSTTQDDTMSPTTSPSP